MHPRCCLQVLSKQPIWNSLIYHFKESGCLVEGAYTLLSLLLLPRAAHLVLLLDCLLPGS